MKIVFKTINIICKERSYKEIVDTIGDILTNMNITVNFVNNIIDNDTTIYLIIGRDLLNLYLLPCNYIIFQIDTINTSNKEDFEKNVGSKYISAIKNASQIWDYSLMNINKFKQFYNISNIYHIPFYYNKYIDTSLTQSSKIKNIDIFFNQPSHQIPRRDNLLNKLEKKYKVYRTTDNIWNKKKIECLFKSKIVINILYDENDSIEIKELWYMLTNKSFIISEYNPSIEVSGDTNSTLDELRNVMVCAKYEKLESIIDEYLSDPNKIKIETNTFYSNWKKKDYENSINPIKLIKDKPNKKKKKKKKTSGVIDYYSPVCIKSVEIEKNLDKDEIKLKLPYISDENLPKVSLITPTKNRRFIFELAIYNFNNINYPKDKIEWIILNNGTEDLTDILPDDYRIKYLTVEPNKYTIGELRNICIENCNNDYIIYMDDDDYYHPNSVKARIQSLLKYKNQGIECVGCSKIGFFNIMNGENIITSNGENYLGEASMAHTKEFWLKRKYNNDIIGEYKNFLIYRQDKIMNIPYDFIMIAINHNVNSTGDNRVKKKVTDEKWKTSGFTDLLFQYFNKDVQNILLRSIQNRYYN